MVAIIHDTEYTGEYFLIGINDSQRELIKYLQDNRIIEMEVQIANDNEAAQNISQILIADEVDFSEEEN